MLPTGDGSQGDPQGELGKSYSSSVDGLGRKLNLVALKSDYIDRCISFVLEAEDSSVDGPAKRKMWIVQAVSLDSLQGVFQNNPLTMTVHPSSHDS